MGYIVILNYRVGTLFSLCCRVDPVLLCLSVVCCDVYPGLGSKLYAIIRGGRDKECD